LTQSIASPSIETDAAFPQILFHDPWVARTRSAFALSNRLPPALGIRGTPAKNGEIRSGSKRRGKEIVIHFWGRLIDNKPQ
jgi:hypothetical protein